MKKRIAYSLLIISCLLSACQSDFYEYETDLDDNKGLLSLSVSTSEVEVFGGTAHSRAVQNGSSTTFAADDCVGLIILDSKGNLLADNVPYKFDGDNWNFDADNEEGKERVYYDSTMSTYIVYYPYDPSVNGIKKEEDIKNLPEFALQEDQSSKDAYIHSDLMIWSSTGKAIKNINANLSHIRKSVSFDLKLKRDFGIPDQSYSIYHPLKEALEEFKILLKDGTSVVDKIYHAEDSTFRYILEEDYEGPITWRYIYRGESFAGVCNIAAQSIGVRFVEDATAPISHDKIEQFDYYCSKDIGDKKYGYVLPWDAEECFDEHRFIGIVLYTGHNKEDQSDYSNSGINQTNCHGYVLALTDAWDEAGKTRFYWLSPEVEGPKVYLTNTNSSDWSAYDNLMNMKAYTGNNYDEEVDKTLFPAANACDTYGIFADDLLAPCNTSGWFLPTMNMMLTITDYQTKVEECLMKVKNYISDSCNYKDRVKYLIDTSGSADGYFSSTESISSLSSVYCLFTGMSGLNIIVKQITMFTRPFLAF